MKISLKKLYLYGGILTLLVASVIILVGRDKSIVEIANRFDEYQLTSYSKKLENAPTVRIRSNYGTVQSVTYEEGTEKGRFLMSVRDNPVISELEVRFDKGTLFVNSTDREFATSSIVQPGDDVVVYHDVSRSTKKPPSTYAYAVIGNLTAGELPALYMEVLSKTRNDDGSIDLLNVNKDMLLTVPQSVTVKSRSGDKGLKDIDVETQLIYYTDSLLLNSPMQGVANEILLPY